MKRNRLRLLSLALCVVTGSALLISTGHCQDPIRMNWTQLPSIPDPHGFAGSFAGVSQGALIVAGGANFPEAPPWAGGTKVWHDSLFVLETPTGPWKSGFRLPEPLGYGVSLSTPEGIILVGGSHSGGHVQTVRRAVWNGSTVQFQTLPELPLPCAMMGGVKAGNRLYVAGGSMAPDAPEAMASFWSLDLDKISAGWTALESWPGPGRMLPIMGAIGESVYLFSGTALETAPGGNPTRKLLKDAYRFHPQSGWKRIADLPRFAVAAPGPAMALPNGQLLIVGGDDGTLLSIPPAEHPGFPKNTLLYDPAHDRWTAGPEMPFSLVTTSTVEWHGQFVIPGGEAKPGVRSTEVWSVDLRH